MNDDVTAVPLTPEEKSDIAEAWLAYIHALPVGAEPDLRIAEGGSMFKATVNRILLAHGFEPFSATLAWTAEGEAVLMARKLPSTATEALDT
ncbi:MAG TPA: hypothetical protein VI172_00720 [Candidatus Dormibacteraeota bacterium]|jgi:hypothetical protein